MILPSLSQKRSVDCGKSDDERDGRCGTYESGFLPLKTNAHIVEGNALRIDWNSVISAERLSYIMGNPPFVGARLMSAVQKEDVFAIFNSVKNNGNLDYVSCWYQKATDMMKGTSIRTALVSTNSITQGEQVSIFGKILWEMAYILILHIELFCGIVKQV